MSRRKSPAKIEPKQMMQLIMQVRGGTLSAKDAAAQLGISRKTWYERENRAMSAMMEALEAKPPGRPTSQAGPELEKLRTENRNLQQQVHVLDQRYHIQKALWEADTRAKKK